MWYCGILCAVLRKVPICDLDATNARNDTKAEGSNSETPTPLYSIGTPSTSDENLFEDVTTQTGDDTLMGIASQEPLNDNAPLKILDHGQNVGCYGDLMASQLEAATEITKPDEPLERYEATGDSTSTESETFLDSIEIPTVNINDRFAVTRHSMLSSARDSTYQPDSSEQANPGLKQLTGEITSASDLELCNPDLSQEKVHSLYGTSEKLRIALQHLESQLTKLR